MCCQLHHPGMNLVAVAGIEPTSLDYQSSALPLSYTAMVDPTGLKPAPHGLKGRCSVPRAPGQEIGCGGRTRTFGNRINSAAPYQLGYATKTSWPRKAQKSHKLILCSLWQNLAAATRVELVSSRLQDERSGAIELRRNLVDWEGLKPSREVCRTSMLSLHHQPETLVAAGGIEPPT